MNALNQIYLQCGWQVYPRWYDGWRYLRLREAGLSSQKEGKY